MDRLFLDANVLFSAAYREDSGLLKLWTLDHATLFSSAYAFEEARVNLSREGQRERLAELVKHVVLAAPATHLPTGDARHFGAYFDRTIEGVLVSLPGLYLRTWAKKRRGS